MSDGARVLTTAEVEGWQVALGRRWGARIGPRGHEVVIEGDRILATTRALETAQTALTIAAARADEARRSHEREAFEMETKLRDEKARVDGIAATFDELGTGYLARAEKAEAERDAARGEARAHRAALDDATASCHGLGCGRCEDCVSMQRARAEKAERERDASRRELAELALEVGYGERPDERIIEEDDRYQAVSARAEKAESERDAALRLAYIGEHRFENQTWKYRCEELVADLRFAERERDEARVIVSELVELVRRDVEMSGKECWEYAKGAARGQSTCTHPKCAWLHDARAALAKAKSAA